MERFTLLSMLLVSLTGCAANDASPYAREADAFLAARDPKVQPALIAAIRRATDGETDDLKALRAARNAWSPLPNNVTAETVSPTMRLYRPKDGGQSLPLLIYLHGGGWVIGSLASCSAFCGAVASRETADSLTQRRFRHAWRTGR